MPELLTIEEVAELTRVPVATLRWWRHLGDRGPRSIKVGRHVRYRREDVEKWLDEQAAEPTAEPAA